MTISADFFSDWIQYMRGELSSSGYETKADDSPDEIGFKFFNALQRRIAIKQRTVMLSKEFSCPSEFQNGFNALKLKIQKGEDLNAHLGKSLSKEDDRLLDPLYDDPLLNDWGIHHFHLGTEFESARFVERTGPILFAKVTDDSFYSIDVMEHGNWSNRQLLEILHSNWPDTILRYRSSSRTVEYNPSDAEIKKLRKGVTYLVQLSDGTVYLPVGGGYAISGVSIVVRDKCDYYAARVRQIEQHVRENIQQFIPKFSEAKIRSDINLSLRLKVFDEYFLAVDNDSKIALRYAHR